MEKINIEKIRLAAARMTDDYWQSILDEQSELYRQAQDVAADFVEAYSSLYVVQLSNLETKYHGYQKLAEAAPESNLAEIIEESKNLLSDLMAEKYQLLNTLSSCIIDAQSLVEAMQTLGESRPTKKEGKNG